MRAAAGLTQAEATQCCGRADQERWATAFEPGTYKIDTVRRTMFRWLIQQRYLLANPFAGIKVRGAARSESLAVTRVFGEGEWSVIQAVAEGLEWGHGWQAPAARRLRFVLDFAYATGLRIGELVGATLGQIEVDAHGDHWLHLVGKGSKAGKVALPPLARSALDPS